jgi:hypothetical protein
VEEEEAAAAAAAEGCLDPPAAEWIHRDKGTKGGRGGLQSWLGVGGWDGTARLDVRASAHLGRVPPVPSLACLDTGGGGAVHAVQQPCSSQAHARRSVLQPACIVQCRPDVPAPVSSARVSVSRVHVPRHQRTSTIFFLIF